jgi:Streptomyces sporulation and cell division protein, SsgA
MDSGTVSAELELQVVIPERTALLVPASFSYSHEDPYAIHVAFHVGEDKSVEWTFARDLLSTGIMGRRGIGDVRVWPSAGAEGRAPRSVLNIEIRSPFGEAHFEAPANEILDFVRRTCQIVPVGKESDHLDFESELTDLLSRGL